MDRFRTKSNAACLVLAILAAGSIAWNIAWAGEVKLKNGTALRGRPVEVETLDPKPHMKGKDDIRIYQVMSISSPLKRYFVPRGQCVDVNKDVDMRSEVYKLPARKQKGGARPIDEIHRYLEPPGMFDQYGRRTVKFSEGPVFQQITELTPEYLKVSALNYDWDTAIATSSVPFEVLDSILRKAAEKDDAEQRLKRARFYIDASRYGPAKQELAAIGRDFPALAEQVKQADARLTESLAHESLAELRLREKAGQYRLLYTLTQQFPVENVPAGVLREVRELGARYEAAHERAGQAISALADLQAELGSDPRVADIAPVRAEISENLNVSNLDRLEAFLKLSGDASLPAADKLALALSGWVVGAGNAVTSLNQALNLWHARYVVLDYLRTANDAGNERQAQLERLKSLEGIGPTHVAQLLPRLPPPLGAAGAEPGQAVRIEIPTSKDDEPLAYWALLPLEYHPDHLYPLLVVLHGAERTPEHELAFWGGDGQSQRHGYIVVAPEYAGNPPRLQYEYAATSHRAVLEALRDARKRFNVDSDRVFLGGHGMGGTATFDIGYSHPDLFAGIIPISGVLDRHCMFYWENARDLPQYIISGQLDRDTFDQNVRELMRMMKHNYNLIFAQYVGAGPDSFFSEIHYVFEWMSRLSRVPDPDKFEARTLRACDNQFYWYEFDGLPDAVAAVDWTADKRRPVRPMNVAGSVNPQGTLAIIQSGAKNHRLWLAPKSEGGLIDFDKKFAVRLNSRQQRFNDFVSPDLSAMLERARQRGDRQRIYWAVLEF